MANIYWYLGTTDNYAWDDHGTPGPWWDDLASLGGGHSDVQNTVGPVATSDVIMLGINPPSEGPAAETTVATLNTAGFTGALYAGGCELTNLTVTGAATIGATVTGFMWLGSCASISITGAARFAGGTAGSGAFSGSSQSRGTVTGLAAFSGSATLNAGTCGSATFATGTAMLGGTVLGAVTFAPGSTFSGGVIGSFDLDAALAVSATRGGMVTV